jgi:hypothetical protein
MEINRKQWKEQKETFGKKGDGKAQNKEKVQNK